MINVNVEGGKELERKLKALERKTAKKVVRKAVRKSLAPVLKAGKANAKTMIGGEMGPLIARHLALRAFKKQRRGSYAMTCRIKTGKEGTPAEFVHITKEGKRYFIPAAIEYGHALPGRGGAKHKDVAAIPFMRTASDAELPKAKNLMKVELKKGIEAVAKHGR